MEFLKNNKRFSFKYENENAWNSNYTSEEKQNGNELITTYTFERGLKITNIAKKYDDFGAYEWVNYIENTSDKPTGIISELWDCDCLLPMAYEEIVKYKSENPDRKKATKIYAPNGSIWSAKEFYCEVDLLEYTERQNHITVGKTKKYSNFGGRSSDGSAPFFNVEKEGNGYIFAIGWTGQWNCEITRNSDGVRIKTKIEDTNFYLLPKEKFRTSSIVIMPYEGGAVNGHNKWRRLVKKHFSLIGQEGRDKYAPLCANMWGGLTSEKVLERIECINKNALPFEYIWMDAGWYGIDTKPTPDEFEGDWSAHTGDWRISPLVHKNGLLDVSKAVHDSGRKFLLWFEPERVIYGTPIVTEHPEYFLSTDGENSWWNKLLDLGNENAWNYCFDLLSDYIEKLKIDCYRQDFNFSPLPYWRKNDGLYRQGITEIKHINGLYRLWDSLLERFPNLIIDNCASGGRRIDIEMLRRSVPLWRSDFQCSSNYDVEATQNHNMTFNLWMPYSGTCSGGGYDEYRLRSGYASSYGTHQFFSEIEESTYKNKENLKILKKYTEEFLKVRPYFEEDFYPLTEVTDNLDSWCAMQFDCPEKSDGIIEVFRRENSPYETARFMLGGIDENKTYIFEDADGGEFSVSGGELKKNGLKLTIPEKRKAKIYFYKSKN